MASFGRKGVDALSRLRERASIRPSGFIAAMIAAGLSATTAATPAGAATQIHAEVGLAASHPVVADGWTAFVKTAEADPATDLDIELFLNGPTAGTLPSLDSLSSGDVDLGFVALPSYPEIFPEAALLTEFGMIGDDGLAAAAAVTELMAVHCEPCTRHFVRRQIVFLGSYSAAPYIAIGRAPLDRIVSWKERKVAAPGSLWDRLLRHLGATPAPVTIDAPAAFGSGDVQALIDIAPVLREPAVWEAAETVMAGPFGSYRGASPFTASRAFWRKISVPERLALMRAAVDGIIASTWAYQIESQEVLKAAIARGITIQTPDPLLEDSIRSFAEKDRVEVAKTAKERLGVDDAERLLETFRALYDKYATLLGPQVSTPKEAAAVLWKEIFARVDPATYGIE